MKYNYKTDYKHVFDTPAKMEQESVIANKIMELLNKNKYNNIDEFINKNPSYQDFLKNNELENVVKHFGNTLSEQDYRLIQEQMIKITELKKSFDEENIKTTNIDEKEYNSYKTSEKTFFLDNSNSQMSLERQMEELQGTEQKFQTTDTTKNTENMMQELEKNKKESLNLSSLNELNIDDLSTDKKKMFNRAEEYELNSQNSIRVDLEKEVLVDKNDEIMKLTNNDGNIHIQNVDGREQNNIEKENNQKSKTFQKTLVPNPNSIYSVNNN